MPFVITMPPLVLLSLADDVMGNFMWGFRLLAWLMLPISGILLVLMLVMVLYSRWRDSAKDAVGWDPLLHSLGTCAFFWPAWGFLIAEWTAGDVPPAAFTAPLSGAMVGWTIGSILNLWNPLFGGAHAVAARQAGQHREQERAEPPG
jgi:hypothetical protein